MTSPSVPGYYRETDNVVRRAASPPRGDAGQEGMARRSSRSKRARTPAPESRPKRRRDVVEDDLLAVEAGETQGDAPGACRIRTRLRKSAEACAGGMARAALDEAGDKRFADVLAWLKRTSSRAVPSEGRDLHAAEWACPPPRAPVVCAGLLFTGPVPLSQHMDTLRALQSYLSSQGFCAVIVRKEEVSSRPAVEVLDDVWARLAEEEGAAGGSRGTRPVVMVDDAEGCDPAALSDLGRTWVEAPGATRPTLLLGARTSSRALAHALDDDVRSALSFTEFALAAPAPSLAAVLRGALLSAHPLLPLLDGRCLSAALEVCRQHALAPGTLARACLEAAGKHAVGGPLAPLMAVGLDGGWAEGLIAVECERDGGKDGAEGREGGSGEPEGGSKPGPGSGEAGAVGPRPLQAAMAGVAQSALLPALGRREEPRELESATEAMLSRGRRAVAGWCLALRWAHAAAEALSPGEGPATPVGFLAMVEGAAQPGNWDGVLAGVHGLKGALEAAEDAAAQRVAEAWVREAGRVHGATELCRDVVARAEALARGDRAGAAAEAGPCDPSPKRGAKAPRRPAKGTDRDRGAQMVMQVAPSAQTTAPRAPPHPSTLGGLAASLLLDTAVAFLQTPPQARPECAFATFADADWFLRRLLFSGLEPVLDELERAVGAGRSPGDVGQLWRELAGEPAALSVGANLAELWVRFARAGGATVRVRANEAAGRGARGRGRGRGEWRLAAARAHGPLCCTEQHLMTTTQRSCRPSVPFCGGRAMGRPDARAGGAVPEGGGLAGDRGDRAVQDPAGGRVPGGGDAAVG